MVRLLSILVFSFAAQNVSAQNLIQNLNISAAADFVAPFSLDNSKDSKSGIRAAEIMLFGPIDQVFDGVINAAGHTENGEFIFGLHEGYVGSSKLIPQSRFRIGKFFLNAGRLNQFHQHDWPFITAPKVHREFLSPGSTLVQAEGAFDTGIEYSWLVPTQRFVEVTVGVTNNYCYGHCHEDGDRPPRPLYYVHPTTYFDFGTNKGMLVGATYLSRIDAAKTQTDLYGIEATYKSRQGKVLKWLLQSEFFVQTQSNPAAGRTEKAGFYIYPQYGIDQGLSFGMRIDGFSQTNLKFASNGEKRNDLDYAVVPTLTYKASEFSTVRLAYAHEVDTTEGVGDVRDRQVQLQFVYILGAHPAHDF